MALGAARGFGTSLLDQLLEEINFQRTKEMRQLMKDESGFVVLQGTTYWTDLFVRHFLFPGEGGAGAGASAGDCDDLLFFVRKRHVRGSSRYLPKYETEVQVFRKDSKKLPIGDPEIDWEETVYLNLIVHQFEYTLTLAICTRTSPKELQVLRRHSLQVYASPSRRKMDTKGDGEEMTYPHICFMVDNFDEVFCDIVVRDGEMVCVELVARGRGDAAAATGSEATATAAVIFLGSIRYDALTRVYDSRQTSLSTKVAQRMSFGWLGGRGAAAARCEFVRMRGPGGKGHAEVAVARPRGAGVATPTSEPGRAAADLWDSDCEEDSEDLFVYRHQRRLSDPSANIDTWARGGWRRDARDKARSENEGLDSLVGAAAEVEAGDLRDAWCCAAPRVAPRHMRDVYARAPPAAADSAACLRVVEPHAPRAAPPARAPAPLRPLDIPPSPAPPQPRKTKKKFLFRKKDKDKECEVADEAGAIDERGYAESPRRVDASARQAVRGREELPCRCEGAATASAAEATAGGGARAYCTLPRRHESPAARLFCRAPLPPRRTTPDGTDIYYWCELPRRAELDDGAYNPLWAMRGFTQTFHLWKEGRRAQCAPLQAYLTYVTLPWWAIAKDILDHREEPILTF